MAAQATPSVPRTYVAPGPDGVAHGTPADEDIFATGPGQTLMGGGGNDIFHIGSFTDANIVVPSGGGVTEVATWVGVYTLPDGVDNLAANGDSPHTFAGNARDNVIVGAAGNDVITPGLGDDIVFTGAGRDRIVETAGSGNDTVHFTVGTGGDIADLRDYGYTSFEDIRSHMLALTGGGTLLQHPNGETLLFLNEGSESIRDVTPNNFTADNFLFSGSAPPPPSGGTQHTLSVFLAEDAFNGDARFTLDVDGIQIGASTPVEVHHGSGFQTFTYIGAFPDHPQTIAVHFINDAWGGTPDMDRNLYVRGVQFDTLFHGDGQFAQNDARNGGPDSDPTAAEMFVNGTVTFTDITAVPSGHPPPFTMPVTVHLSEDAWNGNAQFTLSIDGNLIFPPTDVVVGHSSGRFQDFTSLAQFSPGTHKIDVNFINDAWGGTAETDRNLYVHSMDLNGVHYAGNTTANNASNGAAGLDPSVAVMAINGTAEFTVMI